MRILMVAGTRPEVIKLAPVLHALARMPGVEARLCVTGQHRALLDQALALFGLVPDCDLDLMTPDQDPAETVDRVAAALRREITRAAPDWLIVQGDTSTALGAARAGASCGIPVAHVEAGLRSGNLASPWPEENHRCEISRLAELHFAPTRHAAAMLAQEGVDTARITVTGNPGIDALQWMRRRLAAEPELANRPPARCPALDGKRRLILATCHRRERRAERISALSNALLALAGRGNVEIAFPLHPSPRLAESLEYRLGAHPRIHLFAPPDYAGCVSLLGRAAIVITDSGGLQEEAAALGKPALVVRETTERPEALWAGAAELVGLSTERIQESAIRLLEDRTRYASMARPRAIFGDGRAARRIAARIAESQIAAPALHAARDAC